MVKLLWETVGVSSKKLNIKLPYDPGIPFLGIYTKELKTYIPQKLVHKCL